MDWHAGLAGLTGYDAMWAGRILRAPWGQDWGGGDKGEAPHATFYEMIDIYMRPLDNRGQDRGKQLEKLALDPLNNSLRDFS